MNPPYGKCPICEGRVATVSMSKDLYTGLTCEFSCANRCIWTTSESLITSASATYMHNGGKNLIGRRYEASFQDEQLVCHLVEPPLIPKDIVAEPILAWRIWNVVVPTAITIERERIEKMQREMREGYDPFSGLLSPSLQGVGHTINWDGPVHHATCEARIDVTMFGGPASYVGSGSHAANEGTPAENCTCGVWALKDEATMMVQLAAYNKGQPMAYGQVHLWGRIFEHEKGYRGEYAKPVSLTIYGAGEEIADALAEKYRCVITATDVALPAAKPYDPFQYLSWASSAYSNYYVQTIANGMPSPFWSGSASVTITPAELNVAMFGDGGHGNAGSPTLREKLRHPWSKGPLRWMYTKDPHMKWAFGQDDFYAWTCRFVTPVGFPLWFGGLLLHPLYYLKRALTR